MFGNLFSGWHIVILIALVVLLFGATKLPTLAKSLGESLRIFRKETRGAAGQSAASQDDSAQATESTGVEPEAAAKPMSKSNPEPKPESREEREEPERLGGTEPPQRD